MKDERVGQIMKKFAGLRAKIYSYLKYNNDGDKKSFKDYKKYLKTSQIENKINYLEKKKTDSDSAKEDQKEFLKK